MNNSSGLIALSSILFVLSLFLYRRTRPSKVGLVIFFITAVGSVFLFVAYGVADYFTGNGIDEAIIYHLRYGLKGAGYFEYSWMIVITIVVLATALFILWIILKNSNGRRTYSVNSALSYSLLTTSLLLNPASVDIYHLQASPLISTDFFDYYRLPYIKPSGNKQKNIVFIYAESLERTYFDEELFPGLIKGLRELESRSTYFTNIIQAPETGWTVGGITASQCGIPLITSSQGNSMAGMDQFLPSAVCLGDLLKDKGYHLNYMGGASLDFAGKGKFFKTHGFADADVSGRDELIPKLKKEAYKTGWGLYDDSLLDMVYSRFIELSEAGEKFGLFTLTLDTHHPNGHPSKSCEHIQYQDGSNKILNAVACSDYLITNLIKKIIESPYSDKTVVVLVSDHLALRNTAFDLLHEKPRSNLFMIIDPAENNFAEIQTIGSTMDIGVTLLPFVGYRGDIGFGRNLIDNTESVEDRLSIYANVMKWKQILSNFWDFPTIHKELEIDPDLKSARIDNRKFRIPILIELDDQLETNLKFQFYMPEGKMSLVYYRNALDEDKYFILIDECKNVKEIDKTLSGNGFCLLAGHGKKYTKIARVNQKITYTADEVRKLLEL